MSQYKFTSIATIHSCYKEKFGIPRQSGLVSNISTIEIDSAYSVDEAFRELETFSHIWVIFIFHGLKNQTWKATVRPPRLGGNKRIGVFSSRSMFRPNPVGLSVVELKSIERKNGKIILNIIGGDFLDQTPVIDLKPYIPYADSINTQKAGYAIERPVIMFKVKFLSEIEHKLIEAEKCFPRFETIVTEILQLDPRPAYQEKKNNFSMKLFNYDIKWCVDNENILVTEIQPLG